MGRMNTRTLLARELAISVLEETRRKWVWFD
jgi:hypothetical protein